MSASAEHSKKLDRIHNRMDCFESAQHACQLDVAKTYATREEVKEIWAHTDRNSADIARLQGVLKTKKD